MKSARLILCLSVLFAISGWATAPFAQAQDGDFSWGAYQQQALPQDALDAGNGVRALFSALRAGQVDVLRQLMDEKLLEKYRSSLDDPAFPDLLREIYGGSKITLKRMGKPKDDAFEIDAQIVSPRGGATDIHFELKRRSPHSPQSFHPFVVDHLTNLSVR